METTKATTFEDDKTPIAIRETACRTASKEMLLPLETCQTPVSNAEKWDTSPGTAQNIAQTTNTTTQPT